MLLDFWSFLHNTNVDISWWFRVSVCILDPFNWCASSLCSASIPVKIEDIKPPMSCKKIRGGSAKGESLHKAFCSLVWVSSVMPSSPKKSTNFCSAGRGSAYPFARPLSFQLSPWDVFRAGQNTTWWWNLRLSCRAEGFQDPKVHRKNQIESEVQNSQNFTKLSNDPSPLLVQ